MSFRTVIEPVIRARREPFVTGDLIEQARELMPGYGRTYYRANLYRALRRMESDGLVTRVLVSPSVCQWEVVADD